MHRKLISLFLSLLLGAALAALAQSPTTSAPGNGSGATQEPFGATMDHPNPGSPAMPTGTKATQSTTPAEAPVVTTAVTPAATPVVTPAEPPVATTSTTATTEATPLTTSTPSTTATDSTSGTTYNNDTSSTSSLPRTASDLPLLATIGLLGLGGALLVRSISRNG